MLDNLMSHINDIELQVAYQAAGGTGTIRLPCARPAETYINGRLESVWSWTIYADDDGHYWSFRMRHIGMGFLAYDEFKPHKQRQGARNWARTCARQEARSQAHAYTRLAD